MDHPNAELVRKGYDAFIAGDMEWMNEHLHENIVWHEPGDNLLSGDYRGREAVLAHFANQMRWFVPEFDIHDAVANDDHAVVLASVRARRHDNQQTFEGRYAHIFHVDSQARALESWIFNEDQAAFDEFLRGIDQG
jgi:ketosteroid isomerase-like protein